MAGTLGRVCGGGTSDTQSTLGCLSRKSREGSSPGEGGRLAPGPAGAVEKNKGQRAQQGGRGLESQAAGGGGGRGKTGWGGVRGAGGRAGAAPEAAGEGSRAAPGWAGSGGAEGPRSLCPAPGPRAALPAYLLVVLAEPEPHVVELGHGVRGLVVLHVGAAVLLPHRHLLGLGPRRRRPPRSAQLPPPPPPPPPASRRLPPPRPPPPAAWAGPGPRSAPCRPVGHGGGQTPDSGPTLAASLAAAGALGRQLLPGGGAHSPEIVVYQTRSLSSLFASAQRVGYLSLPTPRGLPQLIAHSQPLMELLIPRNPRPLSPRSSSLSSIPRRSPFQLFLNLPQDPVSLLNQRSPLAVTLGPSPFPPTASFAGLAIAF